MSEQRDENEDTDFNTKTRAAHRVRAEGVFSQPAASRPATSMRRHRARYAAHGNAFFSVRLRVSVPPC